MDLNNRTLDRNEQYGNILIISLRKIGDMVIATAGINLVRKAYPKARITVLAKPLTKQIVENHPLIDEVILYNYTHKTRWNELKDIVKKISNQEFDICIVLDNKPRSAMLAWLAGIPKIVGFEKIEFRNWYLKLLYTDIIKIDYDSLRVQQVKNHENFINRFTGRNEKAKMVMPNVTDDGKRKVDNMLRNIELSGRKKIALCIRSGCLTKDWPLEYFKMTVELLTQKYAAMFYVIGSQADLPFADDFIKMTNADVINFCGQTTLPELGYLLQRSDFFLSVDTGSAHICGAVGTPMVVVFGSTSPQRWGPYTDNAVYISPQIECHPCDGTKRKCVEPACLATIKPDEVYAGVIDLCKLIFMKNRGAAHYDIQQNEY